MGFYPKREDACNAALTQNPSECSFVSDIIAGLSRYYVQFTISRDPQSEVIILSQPTKLEHV